MGCMSPEPPINARDIFQHLLFSKIVPQSIFEHGFTPLFSGLQCTSMNKTSLPNLISHIDALWGHDGHASTTSWGPSIVREPM